MANHYRRRPRELLCWPKSERTSMSHVSPDRSARKPAACLWTSSTLSFHRASLRVIHFRSISPTCKASSSTAFGRLTNRGLVRSREVARYSFHVTFNSEYECSSDASRELEQVVNAKG